ncbi:uncharacterized protein LOC126898838 [Daktulosphaira vitifoliae]|uniref:uncharacterized protein LOC126898838 n=1 Tax=Daktulosphaira vitifoliae TaxID=58002 RepID=UPI0021A97B62|nr:uncharacterized protein LOC126898838 [Daktulosphaira vitifoliae]
MFSGTIFGAFSGHLFSGVVIPITSHGLSYYILSTFALGWVIIWTIMQFKMPYIIIEDASIHSLRIFTTPWKIILKSKAYISLLIASLGFGYLYSFITTGLPIYSAKFIGGDAVKNGINVCIPWMLCWIFSIIAGLISMSLTINNGIKKTTIRKTYAGLVLILSSLMVLCIRLTKCDSLQTKVCIYLSIALLAFERNSIRINSLDLCPSKPNLLVVL